MSEVQEFKFFPLVNFQWVDEDKLMGDYYPGMSYSCTRFPLHDKLRVMCKQWEAEGKIKVMPLQIGQYFEMQKREVLT